MFSMLHGNSPAVGEALVKHPAAQAVGFTGSLSAGRHLFDIASSRPSPIPVYAEMGSINPIVVMPSALSQQCEEIAAGLAGSVNMGAGQFCTSPGVVFLIESEEDSTLTSRFTQEFSRAMQQARKYHFVLFVWWGLGGRPSSMLWLFTLTHPPTHHSL
jgi:NADP-dependent aldehyde dehydrogenase